LAPKSHEYFTYWASTDIFAALAVLCILTIWSISNLRTLAQTFYIIIPAKTFWVLQIYPRQLKGHEIHVQHLEDNSSSLRCRVKSVSAKLNVLEIEKLTSALVPLLTLRSQSTSCNHFPSKKFIPLKYYNPESDT